MRELYSRLYEIFAECFPFIPMSERIFHEKISVPENKLLIRYFQNDPAAFSVINENTVVLICVHPDHQNKGTGSSLLKESEDLIRSKGYSTSVLGREKPDFFFGAVMDTFSHRFFEKRGYTALNGCLGMYLDLYGPQDTEAQQKYSCSPDIKFMFCPENMYSKLREAVASVEPKWLPKYSDCSRAFIAADGDEIAAFMLINDDSDTLATSEESRTGQPEYLGTVPKYRNRHIGTNMLLKGIDIMKKAGCTEVYIDYTSEDTWYSRIGFEDFIWFWMGEKNL